jgi:hypothetical protein
LDGEQYFAPLSHFIGQITSNTFSFKTKLKQTYWQCEWSQQDDMALLRGIYEYGYGNWEWIKADASLGLGQKILVSEEKSAAGDVATASGENDEANAKKKSSMLLKPQSKHLRTRIDYLIKVLQNQLNTEEMGPEWKKKKSSNKASNTGKGSKKSKATIETSEEGQNGNDTILSTKTSRKRFLLS